MNLPVAVLILCGLRILLNQNEFRRKVMPAPRQRHLPYPGRKQLSLNDARLSTTPPPPSWKNKINSQVVENAINDFVGTIVDKFVKKLWYSGITPDKDFPELIRGMIMNAVVEISVRVKEINIFGLIRCRTLFTFSSSKVSEFRLDDWWNRCLIVQGYSWSDGWSFGEF